MKKLKYIALFFVTLFVFSSGYASELKVGVVNAAAVLAKSPQKAIALARLEKEFAPRSKALDKKAKALIASQNKLKKDAAILSATQRSKRERDLINDQRDLQRLQDEYKEDLSIRRNQELQKLEKTIGETISKLAKKEGYDLILYQGVVYASPKVDLTNQVLAMLKANKK